MHRDFSKSTLNGSGDKLDLSSLNTLSPREDSWSKVCARLDAEAVGVSVPGGSFPANDSVKAEKRSNSIPFRLLSAIPLAASLVLVGIGVMLSAVDNSESSRISMNNVTSTELSSWYSNLGSGDSDDFETLDNSITISYLMKE